MVWLSGCVFYTEHVCRSADDLVLKVVLFTLVFMTMLDYQRGKNTFFLRLEDAKFKEDLANVHINS